MSDPMPGNVDNNTAEIEAAKVEVEQKAAQATNQAAKDALAQELIKEIVSLESQASEVKSQVQINRGTVPDTKKAEAKEVKKAVVKVVTAVERGIIKPQATSAKLFKSLSQHQIINHLTDSTASFLYPLITKAATQPITLEDLKESYQLLKESGMPIFNSTLFDIWVEALRSTSLGLITSDEAKNFFQKSNEIYQRNKSSQEGFLTNTEKEFSTSFFQKLKQSLEQNNRLANNDPNKISPDERSDLMSFLYGDKTLDDVARILKKLKIDLTEARRYREIAEKLATLATAEKGYMIGDPYLEEKIKEASIRFSQQNLIRNFIIKRRDSKFEFDKKKFKKLVTEYHYYLFEKIDKNPSQLWSQVYNPFQDGYYLQALRGLISKVAHDDAIKSLLIESEYTDFTRFMDDMIRYSQSLVYYGETYHDLPIYAMDPANFDKWSGFLGRLFTSETADFLNDPVVKITMSELERYIRLRLALNNNIVPSDLFAGSYDESDVIYYFKDQEGIINNIRQRVKELGIDGVGDWEYRRALSYCRGIALANLREPEVIGTSDLVPNFKGIPEIIGKLFQRHKWKQGRGTTLATTEIPELFTMDIVYNPDKRSFISRLFKKRKWVPEKIHRLIKKKTKDLQDLLVKSLLDRKGVFQELMNIFNIGSLVTRAGWRITHLDPMIQIPLIKQKLLDIGLDNAQIDKIINDLYSFVKRQYKTEVPLSKEILERLRNNLKRSGITELTDQRINDLIEDPILNLSKKGEWTNNQWLEFYQVIKEQFGTGALWFYAGDRANCLIKHLLEKNLGHCIDEAEFKEYVEGSKAFDKVFLVTDEYGRTKRLKFLDIKQIIDWQTRGEIFYHMMLRSPGDFFLNLTQLVPEIIDMDTKLFDKVGSLTRIEDIDKLPIKEKEKERLGSLAEKWGINGLKMLAKIRAWFLKELIPLYEGKTTTDGKRLDNRNAIIAHFINLSATALEKARLEGSQFLTENHINDKDLKEILFGPNGLVTLFTQSNEDFGNDDRLGNYGFFYHMGKAWSILKGDTNPNATDLNYFKIYENIGEVGETVIKRLLGDAAAWDATMTKISQLDLLLLHAANSGSLEEIYKLHEEVYKTIRGIAGKEQAQKANYLLACLVSSFFWEHDNVRKSFLGIAKIPLRGLYGKSVSLSKLITQNRLAYSMDENAVRNYFNKLALEMHVIAHEGPWSHIQGQLAFDARTDTFIFGDVGPNILQFLLLYILILYIKKALEESEEKRK